MFFCFSLQLIVGDEWVTGEMASTFLMFSLRRSKGKMLPVKLSTTKTNKNGVTYFFLPIQLMLPKGMVRASMNKVLLRFCFLVEAMSEKIHIVKYPKQTCSFSSLLPTPSYCRPGF